MTLVEQLRKLHQPYRIYDECGHHHDEEEPGVIYIDEVGFVCIEGLMYEVCYECCMGGNSAFGQTENCATDHRHGKDVPICSTVAILDKQVMEK